MLLLANDTFESRTTISTRAAPLIPSPGMMKDPVQASVAGLSQIHNQSQFSLRNSDRSFPAAHQNFFGPATARRHQ